MADEVGGGSECPGCGIAVAPGYPRCPKCHTAMPQARSTLPTSADRGVHAGGTSVGGGDNPIGWLFPVIGLVAVAGIVLFMVTRGGDEPAAEAPAPTKVSPPSVAPEPVDIRPDIVVAEVGRPDDDGDSLRADTGASVAKALERARLWSNVEVDGDNLVISSADCEAKNMRQVLAANQALIVAAGFAMVRCHARHGALVFEEVVSGSPAAAQDQGSGGEE